MGFLSQKNDYVNPVGGEDDLFQNPIHANSGSTFCSFSAILWSEAMVPEGQLVCVWPDDVEKTDSRFAAVLKEFSRRKQSGESQDPLSEDEVRSVIVANDGNDSVCGVVF